MVWLVAAQSGTAALWLFTLTAAATAQMSMQGTTTVVAGAFAGIALGGVATGALLRTIPAYALLRGAEVIRLLVILAAMLAVDHLRIGVLVALCVAASLCESAISACRWQLVQWRFAAPQAREEVSRQLQTLEAFLAVALPVMGGVSAVLFGWRASLAGCLAGSAGAILSIHLLGTDNRDGSHVRHGAMAGFSAIQASPSIRLLLLARVLTGSSLLIWAIYVPVALRGIFQEKFPLYQGALSGLTAAAIVGASVILIPWAKLRNIGTLPASRYLAVAALTVYGTALLVALFCWPSAWAYAASAIGLGLYSAAIRTSIVITGQRITPPNLMAQVVSAGDSIVRSINLALALAFSSLVSLLASDAARAALFATMVAISVGAVLMMARLGGRDCPAA